MKYLAIPSLLFLLLISNSSCNNAGNSSGIKSIPTSDATIKNLTVLGKVWGFLKYYHPAIAKGSYDWDAQLFKILPEYSSCKTAESRNHLLSAWIDGLGKVPNNPTPEMDTAHAKLYPDLNWIYDTLTLGNTLSKQLIQIKNASRTGLNYYVNLTSGIGNPVFSNEKPYKTTACPDAGLRLLALYRYWNIINYFYPNKYLIGGNWDSILTEFIPKFLSDSTNINYRLTALELIGSIHDSHAVIYSDTVNMNADTILANHFGKYIPPVLARFIGDTAIVTIVRNLPGEKPPGLDTGDIILSINNKPIKNAIKDWLPFSGASNYPTQLRNISFSLFESKDTTLKITYERDNKIDSTILKCYTMNELRKKVGLFKKDTCFKYLSPDICYIYPENIKIKYIADMMAYFMKTKGMVIDMRCYPSEVIFPELSRYLLPSRKIFARFTAGNIKTPGLFCFTDTAAAGDYYNPNYYYKGKVVILVNEMTQSQAEFTTMAFRVSPNATVLGSTTAGADGNVSFFTLPGDITTAISGIGVYYPDGKETQRIGIVPDVVVNPTVNGIRKHHDEVLEKAVEIINAGN